MFRLTKAQVLPIGIDIGHDSVKMLQLEVVGDSLAVAAAAKMPMPPEVKAGAPGPATSELRMAVATDLIRQMLRQHPFRGRRVVAALPRDIVHAKNLRLPQMPASEVPAVCEFEARNVFPFDTEQARVHHLVAGDVRQGAEVRQEVILLAAKNEDVTALIEQLNRAGVIIESLDVEPCALYRSIERFIRRREDEADVNVMVDVGVRRSLVVIGKGREISFVKPIDIGGWHFHDSVSKKLGITADEAEALRRRLMESNEPAETAARRDPVRQAVFDATRVPMEELGREISLCLRYYSVTFRGQRPTRLRLVGGEACDPQLQALLNAALVIPVEIGRPLYSVNTSKMKPSDRRGAMSEWALALGLGLRTTTARFGARDGKPRDPNRTEPGLDDPAGGSPSGAEVVDLGRAVREVAAAPAGNAAAAPAAASMAGPPHPTYAERSAPVMTDRPTGQPATGGARPPRTEAANA